MKIKTYLLFFITVLLKAGVFGQSACPLVSIIRNSGNDVALPAGQSCVTLEAIAEPISSSTNDYTVESVNYNPPYTYDTGTQILTNIDDKWSPVINLPFNFCFYGNTFNKIIISSNGLISFDIQSATGYSLWQYTMTCPSISLQSNSIFGVFRDIDPSIGGAIYYNVVGAYPCRKYVVSWYQVPLYNHHGVICNNLFATQQIVLYETSNIIEVYIENSPACVDWNSGNGLVGIQNGLGAMGIAAPGRNTSAWSAQNEAWRFTPQGGSNPQLLWFSGGTQIGTGDSVQVCPASNTTYTVQANYTGCNGQSVTVEDHVLVLITPPCIIADFSANRGCFGLETQFTDNSSSFNDTITGWTWDFGDGSPLSHEQNPLHIYSNTGVYNVSLIVECSPTCIDTIVKSFVIVNSNYNVAFSTGPACLGAATQFTSNASTFNCTITNLTWDFGDGSPLSHESNPAHIYSNTGTYNVTLIINSNPPYADTIISQVVVQPGPSSVNAACSNNNICPGTPIDLISSAVSNSYTAFTYAAGFETWPSPGFTFINHNGTGNNWTQDNQYSHSGNANLCYHYNQYSAADAWAITPAQSLEADTTYTITFWYDSDFVFYPEKLKVTVGTAPTVTSQSVILWNNNGDTALTNISWEMATIYFTPPATGNYYFGFNCYSDANLSTVRIDDISITGFNLLPSTYTWNSVPAGFISSDQNPADIFPDITTKYIVTAQNTFGCTDTASVTVLVNSCGHSISGKTRYAAKANTGIASNAPTYNPAIYDIGNIEIVLKSYPDNTELAIDTSDGAGNFHFSNVSDGNYLLSYHKYNGDTLQWGNDVNAIDISLIKYFIGADTLTNPSRNFSAKYKHAANVDNNLMINAIDLARIRAKVGSPYNTNYNFQKGNWVSLDTLITVNGANLLVNLKTICYGDYNASSYRYRDSVTTWNSAKSLPQNIISIADDYIVTGNTGYFEVPLRISTKMKDFSALGLELNYPDKEYKLVNACMAKDQGKGGAPVKINPSLDEIIADNNDLIVTDEDGVIRVVYATTNHFDVETNDQLIVLGFRPVKEMSPGELDFSLSGTGVIGDQYGNENEDASLIMPKIFIQQSNGDAGFEFAGYPNPFSDVVDLSYSIPEAGTVKLRVYNFIGELVAESVSALQAAGRHVLSFSAGNLPAGMYTFKMEFEGKGKLQCKVLKFIH